MVRGNIHSVKDLKGKTVVYAQNSPSQYFLNNLLLNAGIQLSAVNHKYTATAFEAAAAFVADKSIDACVTWAPDLYNIPEKVAGTRILTTTAEANKLIADVWAARADFAKDHPEIIEGLVAGIFDGMDLLKEATFRAQAFQWMGKGYGMPADEVQAMAADAHSTNFGENKGFFLNANDPANCERTWKNITFVYRELGLIDTPHRFDEVMDFSAIKTIGEAGTFAHQKDEYRAQVAPTSYKKISAEDPILTQTIRINYYPNLEKIFSILHALGQVIVFVDEADLKRQGRLDVHIPLFPPGDADGRAALFAAMATKLQLPIPADELPRLPDNDQIGDNEMEGILVRALRSFETSREIGVRPTADESASPEGAKAPERPEPPTLGDCIQEAINEFRPSAHFERLQLMDVLAVKECTDARFLPKRFRSLNLPEINERIDQLKAAIGD